MSPAWPKCWTPRQVIGDAEEGERVRVAVEQRDDRDAGAEQAVERARVAVAEARAGLEGAEQQVGARDADDLGVAESRRAARPSASGTSAPITAMITSRRVVPRAAGSRRASASCARAGVQRLVDRARREPEVGRRRRPACRAGESACRKHHSKSWPKAGS